MSVQINCVPTKVTAEGENAEGMLLYANERLVAVMSRLSPDTGHEVELWHKWFLEAGFGPCANTSNNRVFETFEAAEAWVQERAHTARSYVWSGSYPIPHAANQTHLA